MDIKLVIWDLDDTLWAGTLADGEVVRLIENRADIVRKLNQCGIVSAICSKNNPQKAKDKLTEFGMYEEFVFPRIDFVPKAAVLQQMIEDMQLRPVNVLFIDDNEHNLQEARHVLPDINIINSQDAACDALLEKIYNDNRHITKSRVEAYRILERKASDRQNHAASQEDFLRSCDLHIVLAHRMDALDFTPRIEELVNRSNQLNFTSSRLDPNELVDFIVQGQTYYSLAIFAWDKYGYYGLIGFAALHHRHTMVHFVFSCRVMHMGIEAWVLARMAELFPQMETPNYGITPYKADWIQEDDFQDPKIRALIREKEFAEPPRDFAVRIMANCQSGALAHFSGLSPVADVDNVAHWFGLRNMLKDEHLRQNFPPKLVLAAFVDYSLWEKNDKIPENILFQWCAIKFRDYVEAHNHQVLVIIPPENVPHEKYQRDTNVKKERVINFNAIWREVARSSPQHFTLIEVAEIADLDELIDVRHYTITLLKKIADRIAAWFAQTTPTSSTGIQLMPKWTTLQPADIGEFFREFGRNVRNGAIDVGRHQYALSLAHGVRQAIQCGYGRVSALELGVAAGNGLLDLCKAAQYLRDTLEIDIQVYGFDTGEGLPELHGYCDHPELWHQGKYPMGSVDELHAKLPAFAHLAIGDVAQTLQEFAATMEHHKLAFVSVDLDFYSSATKALPLFTHAPTCYVPALPVYFDDVLQLITYNEWCGEGLAIKEFNTANTWRKIDYKPHFNILAFHVCHILDHPIRQGTEAPRFPLMGSAI